MRAGPAYWGGTMITFETAPRALSALAAARSTGAVATLALDVNEDGGIKPGYKLKLNSYDLGVDIELHDALQRIRFEHPEVRARGHRPAARSACSAPARTSTCSARRRTRGK